MRRYSGLGRERVDRARPPTRSTRACYGGVGDVRTLPLRLITSIFPLVPARRV